MPRCVLHDHPFLYVSGELTRPRSAAARRGWRRSARSSREETEDRWRSWSSRPDVASRWCRTTSSAADWRETDGWTTYRSTAVCCPPVQLSIVTTHYTQTLGPRYSWPCALKPSRVHQFSVHSCENRIAEPILTNFLTREWNLNINFQNSDFAPLRQLADPRPTWRQSGYRCRRARPPCLSGRAGSRGGCRRWASQRSALPDPPGSMAGESSAAIGRPAQVTGHA